MIHVDPSSAGFESLPRVERARILASFKWSLDAIATELGVKLSTVELYVTPGAYERRQERKRAFAASPHGREAMKASNRRYRATEKGKAMRARSYERRRGTGEA